MRIAIFTLGSRGDVQPYVALAKHAIARGHSAVICTGKSFETFITEHGIEFQEAESDLMEMLNSEEGKRVYNHALRHPLRTKKYVKEVVNPAFRKSLDQFWQSAQTAEVIIYHPKVFGASDMAEALQIPCISMPPVPVTYPIEEFPNVIISATKNFGKTINKWTYIIMAKAEMASIKEVNDFREKTLQLPKRKSGVYAFKIGEKEIPVIYPISPSLFEDVTSWKGNVYLPGFLFLDTEKETCDDELERFIEAGTAPIVISFSSMPLSDPETFKNHFIEALRNTNNRAVFLTGNTGMTFGDEKNIFSTTAVPHTLLFPLAKGIVHHGGVGTMAAALISGKPQLMIPFGLDQPFWAQLLYKKGYSITPLKEKEITVKELEKRFLEMETIKVINKAMEIKDIVSKEDGVENAVKYIEDICRK